MSFSIPRVNRLPFTGLFSKKKWKRFFFLKTKELKLKIRISKQPIKMIKLDPDEIN